MTQKCTAWTHSEAEEGDEEREAKIGGREKRKEGRKEDRERNSRRKAYALARFSSNFVLRPA